MTARPANRAAATRARRELAEAEVRAERLLAAGIQPGRRLTTKIAVLKGRLR